MKTGCSIYSLVTQNKVGNSPPSLHIWLV